MRPRVPSRSGEASPRVDRPEVAVPEAKRPLDASAITIANQGVRVMTLEDLSSAFFSLNSRLERAEGHGGSIFEAVDYNAILFSETCKGLIALKKAQAETEQRVAATVLKVTGDTRSSLEEVHARDVARDGTLRDELNAMAQTLEKGHGLLAAKNDGLQVNLDAAIARRSQAADGGGNEPAAPPGLVNQQIEYLQATVTSVVARLQMAESKAETFEAAIVDTQRKIVTISSVGVGRIVGAADPWQPTFPQAAPTAAATGAPERYELFLIKEKVLFTLKLV